VTEQQLTLACCVTPLLSTACPTSAGATTVTCGFGDTNFGGKLVGILNTLASVFANSIAEFCGEAIAMPSPVTSDYNSHTHNYTGT